MEADRMGALRNSFLDREGSFESLKRGCVFSLKASLKALDLKTHDVQARVKDLDSFLKKVKEKGYSEPFEQITDLVGLRVVCLFLSDLPKVRNAIDRTFEILREDNKVEGGDVTSFGYMSVHYDCRIGVFGSGPRYDSIKHLTFEIQVRTIAMDAWANVSHYLSYKNESSIPTELRRHFHALSGMFYVADQSFEYLSRMAKGAQDAASTRVRSGNIADLGIDAETLLAYIRQRYLDRDGSSKSAVSELADELLRSGYDTLGKLETALIRGEPSVTRLETEGAEGRYLNDVGVVRRAICAIDPEFDSLVTENLAARFGLTAADLPDADPDTQSRAGDAPLS